MKEETCPNNYCPEHPDNNNGDEWYICRRQDDKDCTAKNRYIADHCPTEEEYCGKEGAV
jgi:hypothetical protein